MSNTNLKSNAIDVEIAREVARIKEERPYHGNYREQMALVLSVMFFKFGERVGANRLAALLAEKGRSPSTSTAQDEINKFWGRIRAHSAITIDRPDLPPLLLDLFASVAGKVWETAMAEAGAMFEAHRQEVDEQLKAAQVDVNQTREQLTAARAGTEHALQELRSAHALREATGTQLATEAANCRAAEERIRELTERLAREKQTRLEEFAQMQSVLHELKVSLEQAANEQRRLLAIGDDFKQHAARDRAHKDKAEVEQARLFQELAQLQQQLLQLSGEKGVLEGRLAVQALQLEQLVREKGPSDKPGSAALRLKKRRSGSLTRMR